MILRFAQTIFLILLFFVLPTLPRLEVVFSPPVILAVLMAFLINMTQPTVHAKDLKEPTPRDRLSSRYLFLGGCLIFLIPLLDFTYFTQPKISACSPLFLIGTFLVISGMTFRIWSIRTLGKFFTSVIFVQEGQKVVQNGPYKLIRHPSYLGATVAAFGVSIAFKSIFGVFFVLFLFIPIYAYRIHVEEQTLKRELAPDYEAYMKRTKRLIPFVY